MWFQMKPITVSKGFHSLVCIKICVTINPCPCGYFPNRNKCNCTEGQIQKYLSKISGPILDRIDICVEAASVRLEELKGKRSEVNSEVLRERVMKARRIQEERYKGTKYQFNGELGPNDIDKYCHLGSEEEKFMEKAYKAMNLSARAYHKILKVARTIADLDNEENINIKALSEAINYRMSSQMYW